MIKRITPFSILAIAIGIYCVVGMFEDEMGWGFIFALVAIPLALIIWFVDVGLKKWLKNYKKIFLTEITLVFLVILIYGYKFNRTKTLIIPTEFEKNYVTIIYNVENSKDLSISALTWNKSIEIPKSGILLTSSEFEENLRETEIKMNSGIYLGSEETKKGFVQMSESEFQSNGRNYKFRTWKIQDGFCCSYTSEEVDIYKIELKTEFEKIKASM
ncbi:MAG: hypothetical protein EVB11_13000 [Winogradskyella sp.]|nr:MAG: hypothetical protein EVB11_13000 [Winogradskyella sp.]